MPTHTFSVNGTPVTVDVEDDVRLLWVLRDLLGVTGPKYGCGLGVCQACTSHINGEAFNPCAVPVSDLRPDDEITTIEGLAATAGTALHPAQQVWLDLDVAQCGFCQPGQIMATVALVERARAEGRAITEADLDGLRNVCRCGTYPRIRAAVLATAEAMAARPAAAAPGPAPAPAPPPAAAPVQATAVEPTAVGSLPATGGTALLGPAAAAAGAAVAIRSLTRRATTPEPSTPDEA
jgi:isoquinoline 1-oxidoreductase alpha subunit